MAVVVIRTEVKQHKQTGAVTITAKGKGKQRTVPWLSYESGDVNHGRAAGVLANQILDARQQSMIHHPSGRRRFDMATPVEGQRVITLNV